MVGNKSKSTTILKPFHHVRLDSEFKLDCAIWQTFLTHYRRLTLCRPMVDLNRFETSEDLFFYSDASRSTVLGVGAVFNTHWLFAQWEPDYIKNCEPSIEYLELYGVVAAVLTWGHLIRNKRIILYCDNTAVVGMINNMSSSCKNCMFLLRLLVLNNLVNNRRVFARYVDTKSNFLADSLSRLQFDRFRRLSAYRNMDEHPTKIASLVWPASKIWQKF